MPCVDATSCGTSSGNVRIGTTANARAHARAGHAREDGYRKERDHARDAQRARDATECRLEIEQEHEMTIATIAKIASTTPSARIFPA